MFEEQEFFIEHIPTFPPKIPKPKLLGQRGGKVLRGIFYLSGAGCRYHTDCLTCPLPECAIGKGGRPARSANASK